MISKDIAKKEYPVSIKEDENFPGSGNIFLTKNDKLINIGSFYESSDNKETAILNLYGKASYGDYLEFYITLYDTNAESEARKIILKKFPQYKYILRNWIDDI